MSSENVLRRELEKIEPDAAFTFLYPRVTSSSGTVYYGKIGGPSEAEQYAGEVESLKAISAAAPGLAPKILAYGRAESYQPYFLSEYKSLGSLTVDSAMTLGKRMALEMHGYKSDRGFGFEIPTYCGATRFSNGWHETWVECFDRMIEELQAGLRKKGRFAQLCNRVQELRDRVIPTLLGGLDIEPVLLHGDLWSGNTGTDFGTGQPVIFDPACFYGHNEADLAIARIFGGIPKSFFDVYHDHRPKTQPEDQYELRGDLYEVFHYLNHTLLFGGSYASSAEERINGLLAAIFSPSGRPGL